MSLIKWEPLNDIEAMVDRAFSWPIPRFGAALPLGEWGPRIDISESDGTYLFKADIPGMDRQDLSVTLRGDRLTIQGERKREQEDRKSHFHRIERSVGSFSRSFSLPQDADLHAVRAHCDKGELTITVAKQAGAAAPECVAVPID
ncbi:MAG: Hsp20/alpha crystallin family protein [Chitinophagaceae bacterium]|jgi:HSP20 family protein|nr:Hsp20/alpha crystallin family protein [Chitinophagaceae bacterium]